MDPTIPIVRVDIPHRLNRNVTVGAGLSSWVLRVDAVAKCYMQPEERDREMAVYERLGMHESILPYYGTLDGSVMLRFAPYGTLRQYLACPRHNPTLQTRLQWVEQVTEAIAFIHSKDVIHCDISCNNLFLGVDYSVMVGDFAGSSIDKEAPLTWYGTGHCRPDVHEPSEKTDIFALGSTFYEILTGATPFTGLTAAEIDRDIRNGNFPSLGHLPALRAVISKCWRGGYATVDELLLEIKQDARCVPVQQRVHLARWPGMGLALILAIPLAWWINVFGVFFSTFCIVERVFNVLTHLVKN